VKWKRGTDNGGRFDLNAGVEMTARRRKRHKNKGYDRLKQRDWISSAGKPMRVQNNHEIHF
jgi:hypothetical protein